MDVCGSDDTPGASLHVLALWVVEAYVACQATHIHIHIHIHNTWYMTYTWDMIQNIYIGQNTGCQLARAGTVGGYAGGVVQHVVPHNGGCSNDTEEGWQQH